MPQISMRQLLEAGVHFGHQTRRWDPRMRHYIFGARNGTHILDLDLLEPAAEGPDDDDQDHHATDHAEGRDRHQVAHTDPLDEDTDDDGLVGINSQQMGYRLDYDDNYLLFFEEVWTDYDRGYVGDLNSPSSIQMTSHSNVINQDHLDVIGVGPDTFDEMDFYAALIDYIDYWD